MDIKRLGDPLSVDQIEFRVQSLKRNSGGAWATILVYKDARVDQQRLDEAVGPMNWKREHSRDNKNCTVSIYCNEKQMWVGKEDTGTESNTEAQKGLASDSFKRACFNWGIGRELYDYPDIEVKLRDDEFVVDQTKKDKWGNPVVKGTWKLKPSEWIWFSQFDGHTLTYLGAKDDKGMRFQWGTIKKDKA